MAEVLVYLVGMMTKRKQVHLSSHLYEILSSFLNKKVSNRIESALWMDKILTNGGQLENALFSALKDLNEK